MRCMCSGVMTELLWAIIFRIWYNSVIFIFTDSLFKKKRPALIPADPFVFKFILKQKWFCRKTNILVRFCGEQECSPYRTNLIEYNSC